ncbi:MAG: glycerol-3-phosphate 1-O-acyltransferase [Piscirickettsiaceae bacterium]|nr:MAG: glycerol-3-phosphate 1-O-acyltransferase [Piscirickettsiaceae bacterium]PCI70791.1 MAG: glycerol-3-phosphate 1-O-acyltransferase [Piscirickettsiaceae bacterium]
MAGSFLLRWLLSFWVKVKVLPSAGEQLNNLKGKKVCYVMYSDVCSKQIVLEQTCRDLSLPLPSAGLQWEGGEEKVANFVLNKIKNKFYDPAPERLGRLIDAVNSKQCDDVLIVPVSVFWGRSPRKSDSLLGSLFTDGGFRSNIISRFFSVLFNGRQTILRFSEPVSLKTLVDDDQSASYLTRKLSRVLRLHFARTRLATIGPDQPSPKKRAEELLAQPLVQKAIEREVRVKKVTEKQAKKQARGYAQEIAAVINIRAVVLLEKLLSKLWNKLYDGIVSHHFSRIERLSREHQIVYVPSHQSHMDYLVLSYVLFNKGLAPPHVAAGINLNIPIAGPWMRRCGAFFLRRTFKGNVLYGAVFESYMGYLASKGTAVEYFVEGGRSRTGKKLKAKPGLLAMSVRSYLRDHKRSVVFVPVNFAYEKLVEGETYINELSGKPKKTESVMGVLRSIKALKEHFGEVHVNFGSPIHLNELLDKKAPNWRRDESAADQDWVPKVVTTLGQQIMAGINQAAHVNAVGLLAMTMLSAPKQTMAEDDLISHLNLYLALLKTVPYSKDVTVTEMDGKAIVAYGEEFGVIQRHSHEMGDIMSVDPHQAILMTYFRNNIVHLFALPSFIACCFISNPTLHKKQVIHWFKLVYPFLKSELSMQWNTRQLTAVTNKTLSCLVDEGLIKKDGDMLSIAQQDVMRVTALSKGVLLSLERYYLTVVILKVKGEGVLSRMELEKLCSQVAERLSMLYELNSPEFFDKALFKGFIEMLYDQKFIWANDKGKLTFGAALDAIIDDAGLVLSHQIRRSVHQLVK